MNYVVRFDDREFLLNGHFNKKWSALEQQMVRKNIITLHIIIEYGKLSQYILIQNNIK